MKGFYYFIVLFLALSCVQKKEKERQNIETSVINDIWKLDSTSLDLDSDYLMFIFFNNDTAVIITNLMNQKSKYNFFKDSVTIGVKSFFFKENGNNLIELSDGKDLFILKRQSLMSALIGSFLINRREYYVDDNELINLDDEIKLE